MIETERETHCDCTGNVACLLAVINRCAHNYKSTEVPWDSTEQEAQNKPESKDRTLKLATRPRFKSQDVCFSDFLWLYEAIELHKLGYPTSLPSVSSAKYPLSRLYNQHIYLRLSNIIFLDSLLNLDISRQRQVTSDKSQEDLPNFYINSKP